MDKFEIIVVQTEKQLPLAEAKMRAHINDYFSAVRTSDAAFGALPKSLDQIESRIQEVIDSFPQKNMFKQKYYYELSMNEPHTELRVNKINGSGDYLYTMFTITLK